LQRHVLVFALLFAPPAFARADDAEDTAVQVVENLGCRVNRDGKAPGNPVIFVNLDDRDFTDATLKELKPLRNCRLYDWPRPGSPTRPRSRSLFQVSLGIR
jgi:hypothetical protein